VTATDDRATGVRPSVGDVLPELVVEATVRNIVSTAIATRDYQDVHHDVAAAQERGSQTIFTNILTTNGYCIRLVTDWAGPDAVVQKAAIRLGVPNYAGDTLTLSGQVSEVEPTDAGTTVVVDVRGRNSLGDHVTGTVRVLLPGSA
jgi:acyl dehydratase